MNPIIPGHFQQLQQSQYYQNHNNLYHQKPIRKRPYYSGLFQSTRYQSKYITMLWDQTKQVKPDLFINLIFAKTCPEEPKKKLQILEIIDFFKSLTFKIYLKNADQAKCMLKFVGNKYFIFCILENSDVLEI